MMRKAWIPVFTLLLLLTLTACGGGETTEEEPKGTPLPPQILELGDKFQNNVKDEPSAYVFCKITLEAVSEEDLAALSANLPHIRDIINAIFRAKTLDELSLANAQEILRNEISEQIKAAFGLEELKGVYFEGYYTAQL